MSNGHVHKFGPATLRCECGADALSAHTNTTSEISGGVSFKPLQVSEKDHLAGKLRGRKNSLVQYIYTAITVEDWHAVADAACDLREIDAKLEVLK